MSTLTLSLGSVSHHLLRLPSCVILPPSLGLLQGFSCWNRLLQRRGLLKPWREAGTLFRDSWAHLILTPTPPEGGCDLGAAEFHLAEPGVHSIWFCSDMWMLGTSLRLQEQQQSKTLTLCYSVIAGVPLVEV